MFKYLIVLFVLGVCAGCTTSSPSVDVITPKDGLFHSVTKDVYPQEQSIFGDVYEAPAGESGILMPRLPGEPSVDQEKPPLLEIN